MKRIHVYQEELFEIAKIIKTKIPENKIFIHKYKKALILKIPKKIERLKVEELKVFLKTRYPELQLIFHYES